MFGRCGVDHESESSSENELLVKEYEHDHNDSTVELSDSSGEECKQRRIDSTSIMISSEQSNSEIMHQAVVLMRTTAMKSRKKILLKSQAVCDLATLSDDSESNESLPSFYTSHKD